MKQKQQPPARTSWPKMTAVQAGILGVVLILIGVILAIKVQQATGNEAALGRYQFTPVSQETEKPDPAPAAATFPLLPEAQLDQLVAAGKPALAFFHSNNCVQCIQMVEVVQEVYPEFNDTVALVDVNVYDSQNQQLLERVGLRLIPTMIFIDRTGQGQGHVGVMEPAALREQLQQLAAE